MKCFRVCSESRLAVRNCLLTARFPYVLEIQENNKFIFKVLEMSSNFTKSGNVQEKNIGCETICLEEKVCE